MNKNPETELSNELATPLAIIVKEDGVECPICASGVAPMDPDFGPALTESL
jgi:hypothetical protein